MTTRADRGVGKVGVWITIVLVLTISYPIVMSIIRAHVDSRIAQNHGLRLRPFSLVDRDGQAWNNESLRGKVAILNFTRSKCRSCEVEKPEIKKFAAGLDPEQVVLLSVMTDRVMGFSEEETRKTIERSGFEHPILMADEQFVDDFHGSDWSNVTPVSYFINPEGKIVTSLRGAQTVESLTAALKLTQG